MRVSDAQILNFVNAIADLRKVCARSSVLMDSATHLRLPLCSQAKPTTETKAAAKGKDGKEGKEGKAKKAAGGGENEFVETRPVRTPGAAGVAVLERLCSLLSLYWVEQDIGAWLMSGYVSPAQARWAGEQVPACSPPCFPSARAVFLGVIVSCRFVCCWPSCGRTPSRWWIPSASRTTYAALLRVAVACQALTQWLLLVVI